MTHFFHSQFLFVWKKDLSQLISYCVSYDTVKDTVSAETPVETVCASVKRPLRLLCNPEEEATDMCEIVNLLHVLQSLSSQLVSEQCLTTIFSQYKTMQFLKALWPLR